MPWAGALGLHTAASVVAAVTAASRIPSPLQGSWAVGRPAEGPGCAGDVLEESQISTASPGAGTQLSLPQSPYLPPALWQ